MAKQYHTPVNDWLAMPLNVFVEWIRDSNDLVAEERAEIEKRKRR